MKMKIHLAVVKEIEIDERIFNTLYNIHRDPNAMALVATYEEANERISEITGYPTADSVVNTDDTYIVGVYAEDGTLILEY